MLPNLSLIMEFLGNVFTNIIFEKFFSHEALVTERVTATRDEHGSALDRTAIFFKIGGSGLVGLRNFGCFNVIILKISKF